MNVCGECLKEIGYVAEFVFGIVLFEKDGSVHYCEDIDESKSCLLR